MARAAILLSRDGCSIAGQKLARSLLRCLGFEQHGVRLISGQAQKLEVRETLDPECTTWATGTVPADPQVEYEVITLHENKLRAGN